jgi:tRNA G18 (ribose-2'-O)-methylase SpoU
MRSHVNLSHIVRTCGCFGVTRVIACGAARLHDRIARDGADSVVFEVHRSLPPVLDRLRSEGYQIVGLERTTQTTQRLLLSTNHSPEESMVRALLLGRAELANALPPSLQQRTRLL